jgi:hypothetical protein
MMRPLLSAMARAFDVLIDTTAPEITYAGNTGSYTVDQMIDITCSATDTLSGLASSNCAPIQGNAYGFALGTNTFSATASDNAGNTTAVTTSFVVSVTYESLSALTTRFVTKAGVANSLAAKLRAAASGAPGSIEAYENELSAQSGKALSAAAVALLSRLADALGN